MVNTTPTPDNSPKTSLRSKLLRGGALLIGSKVCAQVFAFVRNLVVARLIGVENYGVAAILAMMVAVFELLGNLSTGQLIIQAKDGNDEKLQRAAQSLQFIKGAMSALFLYSCADSVASLFAVSNASESFKWLALVPLIRGLAHFDPQRLQRDLDYRATVSVEIVRELIPLALAWPFAIWLGDYTAVLWLLIVQNGVACIGSHLLASRKYAWHWSPKYLRRFLNFGWPLVLNSVLLFIIYQGDRLAIGLAERWFGNSPYTLTDLGTLAVAISITLVPTMALGSVAVSLLLPMFSAVQANQEKWSERYVVCSQFSAMIGALFALPFLSAGGPIVVSIYGREYALAGTFIGLLAAAQAIRMARVVPTVAAMSRADTKNALSANTVRCAAFGLTLWMVSMGKDLYWVAAAGLIGELFAWLFCLWRLRADHSLAIGIGITANTPSFATMGLSGLAASLAPPSVGWSVSILVSSLFLFLGLSYFCHPQLRVLFNMSGRFNCFRE